VYLNSEKEPHWKKWIDLYNQKMLSKGTFLDLYIYGYDAPEGYAIEKDGSMFYAFYAGDKDSKFADAGKPPQAGNAGKSAEDGNNTREWTGQVELRGLQSRQYKVVDYVNNKDYGTVIGPNARLNATFVGSLLLQAAPIGNGPVAK
jgi:alpha-galactosidase